MVNAGEASSLMADLTTSRKRFRSKSPGSNRRRSLSRSRSRSLENKPRDRRNESRSPKKRRRSYSRSLSRSRSPSPLPVSDKDKARQRWLDKVPIERAKLIRAVVEKVRDKGRGFEDVLMEREKSNPTFTFFFDKTVDCGHVQGLTARSLIITYTIRYSVRAIVYRLLLPSTLMMK